ncbi:MAG: biotin/lipoate A/B protein ligase family protein [Acidobacteriota bacterium]
MSIRVVDAGLVPDIRSQSLYHGLAYARTDATPDTILLVSPQEPYVSIGFHQELEKEIDMDFCERRHLRVLRREVGGGAVYLDQNQVFTQWVMGPERLPWELPKRFELYAQPTVRTYRALGIDAEFRPVNDIHVSGRKIGGTGAAAIGKAEVMVGSLMFDFDTDLMSRLLKVPSEKFRDKVQGGLREYMTTMREELGERPDAETVKEIYLRECQDALGESFKTGELTDEEWKMIEQLDAKLASEGWLRKKGAVRPLGVKIHQDVWVGESIYKAQGGLIRVTARLHRGRIEDISVSGDFTFHPHRKLVELEKNLIDGQLMEDALRQRLTHFYRHSGVQTPGVEVRDWLQAILGLKEASVS